MSELILIAILALIFIGPKQLPEIAKTVGRLIAEFKKASGDITESFSKSALTDEFKKSLNTIQQPEAVEQKTEKKDETSGV